MSSLPHLFLSPERRGKAPLDHRKTASVDKTIEDVLSDYFESVGRGLPLGTT
jgi:hypothetical protein